MDTCTCMGDSLRCSPETITALFLCVCVGVCFLFSLFFYFMGFFCFLSFYFFYHNIVNWLYPIQNKKT